MTARLRRAAVAAVAVVLTLTAAAGAAGMPLSDGLQRAQQVPTPSSSGRLTLLQTLRGDISPKSVVVSPNGYAFAQNMMYRHSVTVYDRRLRLVRTISDEVRLSSLGVRGYSGTHRGAPVEAAFSADGRYGYVTNYSMYGQGFGGEGSDVCSPSSGYSRSTVYRIDTGNLRIDRAALVGAVPKYVATTRDGRFVLVTNWCTYDLSVVRADTMREVRRIPLGAYPRGIAVGPSSRYAWIAVMGSTELVKVDLNTFRTTRVQGVGAGPRHVVMDPAGDFVYVTLNAEGTIAKLNTRTQRVVTKVRTGSAPRSMDIAADGRSLYVVNYESNTVSKVRTSDMEVIQTVPTEGHPIGISYDALTSRVWVACYDGSIMVFQDR